ncbi:acetyl-CoA carboxylase biotin carboxyl carrier protein [uncultured Ruminococcus sp.]|jgi:acetyl-CoA carboxylase biotin carboxyl carrier protein|uniref:acetyl-CoA carboxylase biotin carboxyl carrier protein n=1 Tax=uncultured Ruminococcus sp. TaxID=165186 RepID=UPI0025D4C38D|nr:acetyl-CoA carboxylase biotin carboxyl carrier protein [uncultured Ruminococcus sp.]
MYNLDEIKEFISLLEDSSLSVFEIQKEDGSKIRLEKAQPAQQIVNTIPVANGVAAPAPVVPAVESAPAAPAAPVADNSKTIDAPIVGVFYAASAPGKAPYVSAGKKVKKGDVVCIIEAMKCMNEIQAEEDGEIVEVLVKDGELVEYGQPLFKIN